VLVVLEPFEALCFIELALLRLEPLLVLGDALPCVRESLAELSHLLFQRRER
jgi:hypothetical protein